MNMMAVIEDGLISPALLAAQLRTNSSELAETIGLGRDAIQRKARVGSVKTQTRLRETLEILRRVEPGFGSLLMAYAWFRSEQLVGMGLVTPAELVAEDRSDLVHLYIDRVQAGVFA